MRKIAVFLILVLSLGLIACGAREVIYKEGTYEGRGEGHHGPIRVQVTTDKYCIKEIKIVEEYEMPELSKIVYDKIPKTVIRKNSEDVNVVTGATYTSNGLIKAIEDGLNKAKI